MDNEEQIRQLKEQVEELTKGYKVNRDRIKAIQTAVRALLAMAGFGAIVWGIPIASLKWNGEEFSFTRDTTSPELVVVGGLVAAALVSGEKPSDLLKAIVQRKVN